MAIFLSNCVHSALKVHLLRFPSAIPSSGDSQLLRFPAANQIGRRLTILRSECRQATAGVTSGTTAITGVSGGVTTGASATAGANAGVTAGAAHLSRVFHLPTLFPSFKAPSKGFTTTTTTTTKKHQNNSNDNNNQVATASMLVSWSSSSLSLPSQPSSRVLSRFTSLSSSSSSKFLSDAKTSLQQQQQQQQRFYSSGSQSANESATRSVAAGNGATGSVAAENAATEVQAWVVLLANENNMLSWFRNGLIATGKNGTFKPDRNRQTKISWVFISRRSGR